MTNLTPRQKAFADEYIKTGNAYQSALTAGYSENYSKSHSNKLLEHKGIKKYIEKCTKEANLTAKMELDEALERLTSIARLEPQQHITKTIDNLTGDILEDITEEKSPTLRQGLIALEHIIKINGGFELKNDKTKSKPIIIIDDIAAWNKTYEEHHEEEKEKLEKNLDDWKDKNYHDIEKFS